MSGVAQVPVGRDEPEQRLDRWFRKRFPHVPQGRIEKMCRKGEIRVDGGRVKTSTRIAPGQVVRVPPLPETPPAPEAATPGPTAEEARWLQRAVLYRDDDLIVLNKPPGIAVQGGSGQTRHLDMLLPALRFGAAEDPRLVHRLDRDTSGALVLARTARAASQLTRLFRTRGVEKIYFAVVAGRPDPAWGTIRSGLVKAGGKAEKMQLLAPDQVPDRMGARNAVTDYRLIDHAGNRAAWVALRPLTGRTHQLRAHMAAIGCPIAGDGKYGGRGQENRGEGWGAGLGHDLSRKLHLHAARLGFPHPVTGRPLSLNAPLPEHMARTFRMMGWTLPEPLFED